jgi:hypothetical protein
MDKLFDAKSEVFVFCSWAAAKQKNFSMARRTITSSMQVASWLRGQL